MGSGEVTSQLDRIEVLCLEIKRMLREDRTPRVQELPEMEADPCGCLYYASVTIGSMLYPRQLRNTCSKHRGKRREGQ